MQKLIDLTFASIAAVCVGSTLYAFTLVGNAHANVNENISPVTRNAVIALYVANDDAQRAIESDVCVGDAEYVDVTRAGDALQGDAQRQYDLVRDALNVAYGASQGSDTAVETVRYDFCAHIGER